MTKFKDIYVSLIPKISLEVINKIANLDLDDLIAMDCFNEQQHLFIKRQLAADSSRINNWLSLSENNYFLEYCDVLYPTLLKEIHDPPKYLFIKGDLSTLDYVSCAVVGCRYPRETSIIYSKLLAEILALNKVATVSGLAIGIDALIHENTIKYGGKTIALLPCGINNIYPQINTQLSEKVTENGLLMSEFMLNYPVYRSNFVRRNRVITGLTKSLLIVEAEVNSGSWSSAMHAISQNKEVMVLPVPFNETHGLGNMALIKEGANVISNTKELLENINIINRQSKEKVFVRSFDSYIRNQNKELGDIFSDIIVQQKIYNNINSGYGYEFMDLI